MSDFSQRSTGRYLISFSGKDEGAGAVIIGSKEMIEALDESKPEFYVSFK